MIGALRHGLIEPADFASPVPEPRRARRRGQSLLEDRLDLQALVLQVELALEPVHDVVGDRALVAQPHDLAPLRLEHLAHDRLVARTSGPRSRRPRSCPRAPSGAGACGTRTCRACARACRRASTPRRRARRSAPARPCVATQPRLELLALLLACRRRCTPSQRISGGSVSPCSTSVTKITAKVRKRIRSRCGKSLRERERGGQRDRAAHARPADDRPRAASVERRARSDSRRSSARIDEHDRAAARRAA